MCREGDFCSLTDTDTVRETAARELWAGVNKKKSEESFQKQNPMTKDAAQLMHHA